MTATAQGMTNALGAMGPVARTAYHVVEEGMKNVLVATGQAQKDVIHVLGMDMISMGTNVPGVGAEGIKNAFPAVAMEEKNVSHVTAEVIKIALGVGDVDMMIAIIAMAKASLIAIVAMGTVN